MRTASLAEARRRLRNGPTIVVLAGSNGAGKTTFYDHFLADLGWPFVNADRIARMLDPEAPERVAYEAAAIADKERRALAARKVSFCMETVFSDPVGDKVAFLREAQARGYAIFLVFIGLADVQLSIARVVQRIEGGGHDVPDDKLLERFPRTLANLRQALTFVDLALVLDNSSATEPYRHIATYERGKRTYRARSLPDWARELLP